MPLFVNVGDIFAVFFVADLAEDLFLDGFGKPDQSSSQNDNKTNSGSSSSASISASTSNSINNSSSRNSKTVSKTITIGKVDVNASGMSPADAQKAFGQSLADQTSQLIDDNDDGLF